MATRTPPEVTDGETLADLLHQLGLNGMTKAFR